jgi:glycosyltransferase involved in cell wall biosynthesis
MCSNPSVGARPRIRVLQIVARLNVGGPAALANVVSDGLDPERFDQRLLAGTVGADEEDYVRLRAPDLPVLTVPGLRRDLHPWADARALARLTQAIRRFRPDIVHTHTAKAGTLGRLGAWLSRVPVTVHTFHGHLLHGYFSTPKTTAVIKTERYLASRTTQLVAVGSKVRDDLLEAGIGRPDQFVVVPPGLPLPEAPPPGQARAVLQLPPDGPVVSYVARLTRVKRPDRFVAVAAEVARRHPSVTFVVAGEGDLLHEVRHQARALGDRVRFVGWRSDIETVYAASDVVVLTSDNEGMPVSLIEAAATGTAAVTTRVGSAPEVVAHGVTGLVTDTDVNELSSAVDQLLGDAELRARMGAAAKARAQKEFSADRLVADMADLYERLVPEKAVA